MKLKNKLGASLVEYGTIVGLISALAIGTVASLGTTISETFASGQGSLASSNAIAFADAAGSPAAAPCDPATLNAGESCLDENGDGMIYGGTIGSDRLYLYTDAQGNAPYVHPAKAWSTTASKATYANNWASGYNNTQNILTYLGSQDTPALACSSIGPGWYLPAYSEIQAVASVLGSVGEIWTSQESTSDVKIARTYGAGSGTYRPKGYLKGYFCMTRG